ncbi:MAG TPA: TRAP transporter large permease subunit, partial [Burkholderiales bacterium]|nr:TRAP transporter large permease subunit [Burkholderiales bacterium]
DLIWFGVLLGVNMQTSFMHPPFGYALFYLRSVAPAKDYVDKILKKPLAGVTTGQIYWGAVPFVIIQVIMVGIVIIFPQLVTGNLEKLTIDPSKVKIEVPVETPEQQQEEAPPNFGPPSDSGGASGQKSEESAPADDLQKQLGGK